MNTKTGNLQIRIDPTLKNNSMTILKKLDRTRESKQDINRMKKLGNNIQEVGQIIENMLVEEPHPKVFKDYYLLLISQAILNVTLSQIG